MSVCSSFFVHFKNEYAYVIGVKLTEIPALEEPELELDDIQPMTKIYHNVVEFNLKNTKGTLVGGLRVDVYNGWISSFTINYCHHIFNRIFFTRS
ncbi:DUF3324 domain-containing protein [Listeria ivanovii]|nr:DUF3324 domain-containing protein [Listeria ivanovii]